MNGESRAGRETTGQARATPLACAVLTGSRGPLLDPLCTPAGAIINWTQARGVPSSPRLAGPYPSTLSRGRHHGHLVCPLTAPRTPLVVDRWPLRLLVPCIMHGPEKRTSHAPARRGQLRTTLRPGRKHRASGCLCTLAWGTQALALALVADGERHRWPMLYRMERDRWNCPRLAQRRRRAAAR